MKYKLGKRPAQPGAVKLKFHDFVDLSLMHHPPASFGHERLVPSWGMLLNDRIYDCAVAGAMHSSMLWNREAGKTALYLDQNAVQAYGEITGYRPGPELTDPNAPQNPTDQGTYIPELLRYWQHTGLVDAKGARHKIGAYIQLHTGDWRELIYACYYFDGVGIGLNFPEQWMTDFDQGKPWDALKQPNVDGGHYVTGVAYRDSRCVAITWGGQVEITRAGYEQFSDETYALLSVEKLLHGVDLQGFDADRLRAALPTLPGF